LNFTLMRNWSDSWNFLTLSISLFISLFAVLSNQTSAQTINSRYANTFQQGDLKINNPVADTTLTTHGYPDPSSVLYKSLIIPGWGQVVNKQAWKVPIVYGLLAGLAGYSIFLTKRYHDYRAAFYNVNATAEPDDEFPNDMRFGSTPDFLQGVTTSRLLQSNRNNLRNRRDFIYVTIALAYGLNAIDAYIFAHLRSFDVSEDLSMRTRFKPDVLAHSSPGLTLSIELFNRK